MMRSTLTMTIAGCLLMQGGFAMAQQPADPGATLSSGRWVGSIDFGGRFGTVDGDAARNERYRDLRDGAATRILLGKETEKNAFRFKLDGIGYRDQRYQGDFDHSGKIKIGFLWDSIPLNYSYMSSTPWVEASPGVFTLDRAARLAVQNGGTGIVGVPGSATQLLTPSIYRGLASPFGIQARRDIAGLTGSFMPAKDLALNVSFMSTAKTGHEPKGASFGFSVADQLPVPLDNRTNDVSTAAEWLNEQAMFRLAWDGSWFSNNIHQIVFDNPVRADDTFPIDASGYSNGRGAATGRMSAPPSNSLNTFSAAGLYKMPGRSNVNGTVSFTTMKQNEALIPWTSNQVINTPAVFQGFPNLASLPRSTTEAKVKGMNALLDYTSRPNRFFGLTARYRYNDHRNLTPMFDATEYVRLDAVPEETGGPTEHFNVRQNTFDVNATFNVMRHTDVRVGYTVDDVNRTGREFSNSTDYTVRTTLDTVGSQYVMLRLIYEHSQRVGNGFAEQALEDAGFQPGLRTFDVSDRARNRGWVVLTLTPASIFDVTVSVAGARDRFGGEGHQFGLLNNDNIVFNVGANARASTSVQVGANYGRDTYKALQKSRNASPPGTDYGSWFDPNRDWMLNQDETVNNAAIYMDLLHAIGKTDIRLGYDYSDSNNAYIHSGPRIQELSTATVLTATDTARPCAAGLTSCFEPLPPITNKWQRLTADVRYMLTTHTGVGAGYWFEKFDVSDYATVDLPQGSPRIDYLGVIGTGYGNRPYKANTGFVRVLYRF